MSLLGLSADKAAGPSVDEIKRKRIAIHSALLIGFSLHGRSPRAFTEKNDAPMTTNIAEIFTLL